MEKKQKKTYEVPALTVATFKAERGYALSDQTFKLALTNYVTQVGYGGQYVEERTYGTSWGGDF